MKKTTAMQTVRKITSDLSRVPGFFVASEPYPRHINYARGSATVEIVEKVLGAKWLGKAKSKLLVASPLTGDYPFIDVRDGAVHFGGVAG